MSRMIEAPITVVAGGHVFHVLLDDSEAPRRQTVTVRNDRGREWTFEEPAWRPLSYGLAGERFLLWSARRLIVFPAGDGEPELIECDEDVHYVFAVDDGWLLVCETSVRLVRNGNEQARLELPEVVSEARIESGDLTVSEAGGREFRVRVTAEGLAAA